MAWNEGVLPGGFEARNYSSLAFSFSFQVLWM